MPDTGSPSQPARRAVVIPKPPSPVALRRMTLGLEQRDVCLMTGMTQPWLSLIENGHRRPRHRTMERLAAALDCEVGDIFPTTKTGRK